MFVANIGGSAQQHERILAMSDGSREGLDRRDFMVAAVGASAALAANSGAQGADQANSELRRTVYTGDIIDGKKVISALNIDDLEPGKKPPLLFSRRPDGHRATLVRVRDGRQGRETGQAHRAGQRCAWRRDQSDAHDTDPSWTSLILPRGRARYWLFWMYHVRQLKEWRGDGQIQGEASISLTCIASGPGTRMAPLHLRGTLGCC